MIIRTNSLSALSLITAAVLVLYLKPAASDGNDSSLPEVVFTLRENVPLVSDDQTVSLPQWFPLRLVDGDSQTLTVSVDQFGISGTGVVRRSDTIEPRSFRVAIDRLPLQVRSDAVGIAYRNQVFPLSHQNGKWLWLKLPTTEDQVKGGWVDRSNVEFLPPTAVAPSHLGHSPVSVAIATTRVDWNTEEVTVATILGRRSLDSKVSVFQPQPNEIGTVVAISEFQIDDRKVTFQGPLAILQNYLIEGTNSLWVTEQTDFETLWHRVDLPTSYFTGQTTLRTSDGSDEEKVLSLFVENLLPGATLEVKHTEMADFHVIDQTPGSLPRIVDILPQTATSPSAIRVLLPSPSSSGDSDFFFRLTTLGGGTSQITVKRQHDQQVIADPGPMTTASSDATAIVCQLELQEMSVAAFLLEREYLTLEVVSALTGRSLKKQDFTDSLIVRQGIPAGQRVAIGTSVLVGVADQPHAEQSARQVVQDPPLLDVNTRFGFVEIEPSNERLEVRNSRNPPVIPTTGPPSQESALLTLWTTDTGVDLNPSRNASQSDEAGLIRLIAQHFSNRPDVSEAHDPFGKVFATAKSVLANADSSGPQGLVGENQVAHLADWCTSELRIEVAARDRLQLVDDWKRSSEASMNRYHLDRNSSGDVADEVVTWILEWLTSRQHYSPLNSFQITGQPGALSIQFGDRGSISPDIFNTTPLQRPVNIPNSHPLKQERQVPQLVRVPELEGLTFGESATRVNELGSRINNHKDYFSDDLVTSVTPAASTWVDFGTELQVKVQRRVPNLVGFRADAANDELRELGFEPQFDTDYKITDIVEIQVPSAGNRISASGQIRLKTAVLVPSVVGLEQEIAVQRLERAGLGWIATTAASATDRVVEQSPSAGTLVRRPENVSLTLHVRVPQLVGLTLDSAKQLLSERDLKFTLTNISARGEDRVRRQQTPADQYVPHGSSIRLGPITTVVPNLTGMTFQRALDVLDDEGFVTDYDWNQLSAGDTVTSQYPAHLVERERGATITLDGRVTVPNVVGSTVASAMTTVSNAKGDFRVNVNGNYLDNDTVLSQSPEAGTSTYPRTPVNVVPGVLVPNVIGMQSRRALDLLDDMRIPARTVFRRTVTTTDPNQSGIEVIRDQSTRPGVVNRSDLGTIDLGFESYQFLVNVAGTYFTNQNHTAVLNQNGTQISGFIDYHNGSSGKVSGYQKGVSLYLDWSHKRDSGTAELDILRNGHSLEGFFDEPTYGGRRTNWNLIRADLSGTYIDGRKFIIRIKQSGTSIQGTMDYRNGNTGTLSGRLDGNRLILNWSNRADYGKAVLRIEAAGRTLRGYYTVDNHGSSQSDWFMDKQ